MATNPQVAQQIAAQQRAADEAYRQRYQAEQEAMYAPSRARQMQGAQMATTLQYQPQIQRATAGEEINFQRQLDELNAAATERMLSLWSKTGGAAGGYSATAPPRTPAVASNVAPVALPGFQGGSAQDASNAAFARAKDRIGGASQGALRSLQGAMSSRGISGSGIEGAETGRLVSAGVGALGEASRDIALQEAARAAAVEDRNVAAQLEARGQDISLRGLDVSQRGQNVSERGQDISLEQSRIQAELERQQQILALIRAQQERNYLF